jgi:cytochrome c
MLVTIPRLVRAAASAAAITVISCSLSQPYRTVDGGDASRGARALENYGCGSCHVIPGIRNADGMVGPPLNWFGRRTMIAGEVANTPDTLVAWLMNPQRIEPRTAMPNLNVTESDARDMAAYLYRLH